MTIWNTLGLEPTNDLKKIKRAYSGLLKQHRPDTDPQGYQSLREAFDQAVKLAKAGKVDVVSQPVGSGLTETAPVDAEQPDPPAAERHVEEVVADEPVDRQIEPPIETHEEKASSEASVDVKSEPPSAQSVMQARVLELVQEVHEFAVEGKEVEAVALFQEQLASEELVALDYVKGYELQVLDYFNWWCQKRIDEKETWLPLGFMRQVIHHYQWHKSGLGVLSSYPAFEHLYDVIYQDSGEHYLRRVRDGNIQTDVYHQRAAKRLLGKLRPAFFTLLAMSSKRKQAIFSLLDRVSEMNDASFQFELNTPTINWWLRAKQRYLFEAWMLIVGMVGGGFLLGKLTSYVEKLGGSSSPSNIDPVFFVLPYISCAALASYLVYKASHLLSIGYRYSKQRFDLLASTTQEIIRGGSAIVMLSAGGFAVQSLPWLEAVMIILSMMLLCYLFTYRALWILGAYMASHMWYEANPEMSAGRPSLFGLLLIVLIVNTLMFWGYLDFKSRQRKRNYKLEEMSSEMSAGVSILVILTTLGMTLIQL